MKYLGTIISSDKDLVALIRETRTQANKANGMAGYLRNI